jgi:hypothetical protein
MALITLGAKLGAKCKPRSKTADSAVRSRSQGSRTRDAYEPTAAALARLHCIGGIHGTPDPRNHAGFRAATWDQMGGTGLEPVLPTPDTDGQGQPARSGSAWLSLMPVVSGGQVRPPRTLR